MGVLIRCSRTPISDAARTDGFRLNSAAVIAATRDVCVANTDN